MFADILIEQITIGPRFRQDLGDITALAESIEHLGLLHPIIVTEAYALIVGRRRLAAHVHLGRATIEARVVNLDDPFGAEVDENEQRKDYTISERVAIGEAREERDKEEAAQRMTEGQKSGGRGKKKLCVDSTQSLEAGKARDITAKYAGMGWQAYERAKKVVQAAREDEEFQDLVEEMDRTGKVTGVYNQLPLYMRTEPAASIPRTPRPLTFPVIMQRLDQRLQAVLLPNLSRLNTSQRSQVFDLLQLYLDMLSETTEQPREEETPHGANHSAT